MQADWIDLAREFRTQLAARLPTAATLSPSELKDLAEAARAVLWFDMDAQSFDAQVEEHLQPAYLRKD